MNRLEIPANIALMNTNDPRIKNAKMIKSLDTFDGMNTNNFHPEGLFSTEIFGRVGTRERDTTFSFIHTKIPVLNPVIYNTLCKLKGLYKGIISGKQYAEWDEEQKDFVSSDLINGDTGFAFFLSKLSRINFKKTGSDTRDANIILVKKALAEGTALVSYVPVFPAGLRDAYIEANGRVTEDEVNPLYRSLLASANSIPDSLGRVVKTVLDDSILDEATYNTTRLSLQNALNNIFEYFWGLYAGKRGFGRDKYYSRAVFNGTRNVLTAICTTAEDLDAPHTPSTNSLTVGLFQTMKMLQPVTIHLLKTSWLGQAFETGDGRAYLVDRKTKKPAMVAVSRTIYDRYTTPEGLIKCINGFFNKSVRNNPVIISGHYLALVYKGVVDGKKVFKVFKDISELPKGLDVKDVHPITWAEMYYLAGYRKWNTYPAMFTRYPVAGLGSTFMSWIYCKTTIIAEQRWELDDDWGVVSGDGHEIKYAYEYPIISPTSNYFETVSISGSRLAGAGADFDGDMGSQIAVYTDESIAEVKKHLGSAMAYINPKGGLLNSPFVDTTHRVVVGLMRR